MNLTALPTSAASLTPRSGISDLETLWQIWSLLPRLKLYLNLMPHGGLLHLLQRIISLGGNKLFDIRLKNAQVTGHLSLLRSNSVHFL